MRTGTLRSGRSTPAIHRFGRGSSEHAQAKCSGGKGASASTGARRRDPHATHLELVAAHHGNPRVIVAQDLFEGISLKRHGAGAPLVEANPVTGSASSESEVHAGAGDGEHRAANDARPDEQAELVCADL